MNYFGNDKKRFQLEVPDNKTHKVNSKYQIEGSRKGFKRYSTARTKVNINTNLYLFKYYAILFLGTVSKYVKSRKYKSKCY